MRTRSLTLAAAVATALVSQGRAQSSVDPLLLRAREYLQGYQHDLGSIVSEERYEQTARTRNIRGASAVLRSDFLLVQIGDLGWVPFRDVFELDGRPVRDREDRLTKLLASSTPDGTKQAQRIVDESARFNIGRVRRTINVPTVALRFLAAQHAANMSFVEGKPDAVAPGRVVSFWETGRSTIIRSADGRGQPASGRVWIDESTGAILRTELHVTDQKMEADVAVVYEMDPTLKLWVPARLEERYVIPIDGYELLGVATYSKFRKFTVTTQEGLAPPPF